MGSKKRIGIFGGTFDPVHNGHVAIAQSFLDSGYIDRLWALLNPHPPHKNEDGVASYSQRLAMLQAAFRPFARVQVSNVEATLPKPSYSVQTLSYLKKEYPRHTFFLCIGKDSFLSFKQWYKWKEILTYCELLVAERPVLEQQRFPKELLDQTHFVAHKPVDISSTHIRQKLQHGEPVRHLLPADVLTIIKKEELYHGD